MLDTDIPYLDPLLFHLRGDKTLSKHFTEDSFFMPHYDLVNAVFDAKNSDCVLPKSLWILPQDTEAAVRNVGCKAVGRHTFVIVVAVKCIRSPFILSKKDSGKVQLEGQFMELMQVRKLVKESVHNFAVENYMNTRFSEVEWMSDRIIYPPEEKVSLIASASEFNVKIY